MQFSVLGSGSRGNSVLVQSATTAILIDNGFSGKELARRLALHGLSLEMLDAVFVTHEHNDHTGGVGVVSRRCKLPVYANEATFGAGEKRMGKLHRRCEFETGDLIEFQDLAIRSFRVSHDTADPVGYVVESDTRRLGYLTDTGKVTHLMGQRLKGCHGLILEFNHDPELLRTGPYPLPLQQRVRSNQGHLANRDAGNFLQTLLHAQLRHVVLAHLSDTNNLPVLAMQEAKVAAATVATELQLTVASQESPTPVFSL